MIERIVKYRVSLAFNVVCCGSGHNVVVSRGPRIFNTTSMSCMLF